ncbi:hypothetical protein KDW_43800 [Dictyobacter vulcani]|uniref:Uncharacterized protein n=1 Tax=Dictyobacter vulcani TaxID=2607529 RepID=A0A5J4KKD2_9CHLR|nr:hypothetical protein KDW_43800 [Dictyobacter vulcani]
MTVSVKASYTSGATQSALAFVQYSVPHEGHTDFNDDRIIGSTSRPGCGL